MADKLDNQEIGSNEVIETPIENIFYPEAEATPELEESTELEAEETPTEAAEAESVEAEKVEESEVEEAKKPEFSDDELVVDLNGREITVQQIKDWESGSLKQKDYTQKTMALADDKRAWEADKQKSINDYVSEKHDGLDDGIATLEAIISESDTAIDWNDLREYDPSEYLKQTEIKSKRLKAVEDAKALRNKPPVSQLDNPEYVKQQQDILKEANPNWLDKEGNQTVAHTNDIKMLSEYMDEAGYTSDEQKGMDAKHYNTLLDAARYRQSLKKAETVTAKIKKLPVTTKPKKGTVSNSKTVEQLFYG